MSISTVAEGIYLAMEEMVRATKERLEPQEFGPFEASFRKTVQRILEDESFSSSPTTFTVSGCVNKILDAAGEAIGARSLFNADQAFDTVNIPDLSIGGDDASVMTLTLRQRLIQFVELYCQGPMRRAEVIATLSNATPIAAPRGAGAPVAVPVQHVPSGDAFKLPKYPCFASTSTEQWVEMVLSFIPNLPCHQTANLTPTNTVGSSSAPLSSTGLRGAWSTFLREGVAAVGSTSLADVSTVRCWLMSPFTTFMVSLIFSAATVNSVADLTRCRVRKNILLMYAMVDPNIIPMFMDNYVRPPAVGGVAGAAPPQPAPLFADIFPVRKVVNILTREPGFVQPTYSALYAHAVGAPVVGGFEQEIFTSQAVTVAIIEGAAPAGAAGRVLVAVYGLSPFELSILNMQTRPDTGLPWSVGDKMEVIPRVWESIAPFIDQAQPAQLAMYGRPLGGAAPPAGATPFAVMASDERYLGMAGAVPFASVATVWAEGTGAPIGRITYHSDRLQARHAIIVRNLNARQPGAADRRATVVPPQAAISETRIWFQQLEASASFLNSLTGAMALTAISWPPVGDSTDSFGEPSRPASQFASSIMPHARPSPLVGNAVNPDDVATFPPNTCVPSPPSNAALLNMLSGSVTMEESAASEAMDQYLTAHCDRNVSSAARKMALNIAATPLDPGSAARITRPCAVDGADLGVLGAFCPPGSWFPSMRFGSKVKMARLVYYIARQLISASPLHRMVAYSRIPAPSRGLCLLLPGRNLAGGAAPAIAVPQIAQNAVVAPAELIGLIRAGEVVDHTIPPMDVGACIVVAFGAANAATGPMTIIGGRYVQGQMPQHFYQLHCDGTSAPSVRLPAGAGAAPPFAYDAPAGGPPPVPPANPQPAGLVAAGAPEANPPQIANGLGQLIPCGPIRSARTVQGNPFTTSITMEHAAVLDAFATVVNAGILSLVDTCHLLSIMLRRYARTAVLYPCDVTAWPEAALKWLEPEALLAPTDHMDAVWMRTTLQSVAGINQMHFSMPANPHGLAGIPFLCDQLSAVSRGPIINGLPQPGTMRNDVFVAICVLVEASAPHSLMNVVLRANALPSLAPPSSSPLWDLARSGVLETRAQPLQAFPNYETALLHALGDDSRVLIPGIPLPTLKRLAVYPIMPIFDNSTTVGWSYNTPQNASITDRFVLSDYNLRPAGVQSDAGIVDATTRPGALFPAAALGGCRAAFSGSANVAALRNDIAAVFGATKADCYTAPPVATVITWSGNHLLRPMMRSVRVRVFVPPQESAITEVVPPNCRD